MNDVPRHARWFLALGGGSAALAVALGAAGTHALRAYLGANDPAGWFQVALQYHQLHALGLVLVGLAAAQHPSSRGFVWAGWLLVAGIALFSGSLYLRSLAGIHALHAATPVGGAALIAGWLAFAAGAWRLDRNPPS